MKLEDYLGDGVYVTFDGYITWLDLRGQGKDRIGLEPEVFQRLVAFGKRATAAAEEVAKAAASRDRAWWKENLPPAEEGSCDF